MAKSTILITGASAGIGAKLAKVCAREGHDLVLVARRKERLDELAANLATKHGTKTTVIVADLENPGEPTRIFGETVKAGIEIDGLINNAGFGTSGEFASLPLDREVAMIQVNVQALVALTLLFLPGMKQRRRGHILNIGSMAGFQPGPFMSGYYATKAFVNSFSQALSWEVRGQGVSVTLSCPGATATEFGHRADLGKTALFRFGVASARSVAEEAYRAMMRGDRRVIHGFMNRIMAVVMRAMPMRLQLLGSAALNRKK